MDPKKLDLLRESQAGRRKDWSLMAVKEISHSLTACHSHCPAERLELTQLLVSVRLDHTQTRTVTLLPPPHPASLNRVCVCCACMCVCVVRVCMWAFVRMCCSAGIEVRAFGVSPSLLPGLTQNPLFSTAAYGRLAAPGLLSLLPSLEGWDYWLGFSRLHSKHFTHWAILPALEVPG